MYIHILFTAGTFVTFTVLSAEMSQYLLLLSKGCGRIVSVVVSVVVSVEVVLTGAVVVEKERR